MTAVAVRRLALLLNRPASNLRICAAVSLATAGLLLVEASLLPAKPLFLLLAVPTVVAAVLLVLVLARAGCSRLDDGIQRMAASVGLSVGPRERRLPTVLAVVVYCAGLVGAAAAYAWLALTDPGFTRQDVIVQWGLMDKRQLVFLYLIAGAFAAFHHGMTGLLVDTKGEQRAPTAIPAEARRSLLTRLAGAVTIALVVYCWIGAVALLSVVPDDGPGLAKFHELHSHIQLAALSQIRLGAVPYLEAQTQYGLGNQLLIYALTDWLNFSIHGFHGAVLLINVAGILAFFIIVQQVLGLGWAAAALLGWTLWPSPADVLDFTGWAILTRWIALPILAFSLAWLLLLSRSSSRRTWMAASSIGALWGASAFMSQENLSAGLLLFVLSLTLYAPVSRKSIVELAKIAGLFGAGGAAAFTLSVGLSLGFSHVGDVLHTMSAQSGLVVAGLSNTAWSDDLGAAWRFDIVNGWPFLTSKWSGGWRGLLQTYGLALLLMVAIALLGGALRRLWPAATGRRRALLWKFAGVTLGAYVLHFFSLLRSDLSHLSGPSLLLPLFLLMLPVFAWTCLRPGKVRGLVLLVSLAIIFEGLVSGRAAIARRAEDASAAWRHSATAIDLLRELRNAPANSPDPAARYTPIPRYQTAIRAHPSFAAMEELVTLLREQLHGRPVELAFQRYDDLITDAELLYLFGGFRSVSGITSQKASIWLTSDEDAWIAKVLAAKGSCVFFDSKLLEGRMYEAWQALAKSPGKVVSVPIVGRRAYGLLSCKATD